MNETVEQLEIIIRSLSVAMEDVLKKLHSTSSIADKEKIAGILNTLSSSQKNIAETIDCLESVNYLNFGIDDDPDDDFFFDDDPVDLPEDNRIEFKKSNKNKKKKHKNRNKTQPADNTEDLPF
ncbi:MAG: hypothetical protein JW863_02250 [Chitinispirillaceae bacterium]|nr:hypothetical protein [Chitinispirillaceae bacterium]